jgi:hypothetical protein
MDWIHLAQSSRGPRALSSLLGLGGFLVAAVPACGDSSSPDIVRRDVADDVVDADTQQSNEPGEAADAGEPDASEGEEDAGEDEDADATPEPDAGEEMTDAGPPLADAEPADGSGPPVISAPPDVVQALCSDAYDSVQLTYSTVTRGSWQANPGGTPRKLAAAGYPCAAFLEEKATRPADDDPRWTDAVDGAFLGFSEPSIITTTDYEFAQFRYFRSFIFVPPGANLTSLSVDALGIDDSVYLELTNSRYPQGVSPRDVGPADPAVGACQGNGTGSWNLAKYMAEGEINVLLLIHADLAAVTSTLTSVDVRADGAPIQLVSCKK